MSQRTRQQRSEKRKLEQDRLVWEGQPQKEKAILATSLGIAALVVYTLTLYPSFGPGDSAELTTVACSSLGVSSPRLSSVHIACEGFYMDSRRHRSMESESSIGRLRHGRRRNTHVGCCALVTKRLGGICFGRSACV